MPSINVHAQYAPVDDADQTPVVRPPAVSGGHTHGHRELEPDATVRAATALTWHRGLRPVSQAIILLCRTPSTPVEIAATLAIPQVTVDALVQELSATGLVTVEDETARYSGRHRAKDLPDAA
jgi:hypothetical protein